MKKILLFLFLAVSVQAQVYITRDSVDAKVKKDLSDIPYSDAVEATKGYIPLYDTETETLFKTKQWDLPISGAVSASQTVQDVVTEQILGDYATNARATVIEANNSEQDSILTTLLTRIKNIENHLGGVIITPDPHTNLIATGGNFKIDLSWTETTHFYDSTWVKYKLPSVSTWTYLAKVDSGTLSYEHSPLGNGITYNYVVYAIKDGNIGGISNIATATTNTPIGESEGLFLADFEGNNLNKFSSTTIAGISTFETSSGSALHGNYGLKVMKQDGELTYGQVNFSLRDSARVRFYVLFDTDSIFMSSTNGVKIFGFFKATSSIGNTQILLCPTTNNFGANRLRIPTTSYYPDVTDTIYIESFYQKGTGANGILKVWINGVLEKDVSNLTDTVSVDNFKIGLVATPVNIIGDTSWIYIDDIKMDNKYIGSYDAVQSEGDNAWFADNTATGANNGTSWLDAWTSFSSINWTSIVAGDTIYISGGSVSKTYNEQLTIGKSGSSGNPITITKGLTSGHNGEVIIDGQSTRPYGIYSIAKQYINIKNLTVKDGVDNTIRISTGSHYTNIKNCKIKTSLGTQGLLIWLSSNVTIEGNYFWNDEDNGIHIDNDLITFNGGITSTTVCTTLVIKDNEFHNYSTTDTDHSDIIQGYLYADVEICRNYMVNHNHKAGGETSNQSGLYFSRIKGTWKIHNNVVIDRDTVNINGKINFLESDEVRSDLDSVFIYNNSLLLFGSQKGISVRAQYDPSGTGVYIDIRNNAIYGMKSGTLIDVNTGTKDFTAVINYNIAKSGGSYYVNGIKSFAQMQSAGYQTNGLDEYPGYTSVVSGSENLVPTGGGNLIDAGATLGAPYNVDILGVTRPVGAGYDVGAYEYNP